MVSQSLAVLWHNAQRSAPDLGGYSQCSLPSHITASLHRTVPLTLLHMPCGCQGPELHVCSPPQHLAAATAQACFGGGDPPPPTAQAPTSAEAAATASAPSFPCPLLSSAQSSPSQEQQRSRAYPIPLHAVNACCVAGQLSSPAHRSLSLSLSPAQAAAEPHPAILLSSPSLSPRSAAMETRAPFGTRQATCRCCM